MSLLGFFELLRKLDPKALKTAGGVGAGGATVMILIFTVNYVDEKHAEAIEKINRNNTVIQTLVTSQGQIMTSLAYIADTLKESRADVKEINEKLGKIRSDVEVLKAKVN